MKFKEWFQIIKSMQRYYNLRIKDPACSILITTISLLILPSDLQLIMQLGLMDSLSKLIHPRFLIPLIKKLSFNEYIDKR